MSDQTARKMEFPAACVSCGGQILAPVSFCPHCGARARLVSVAGAAAGSHASQETGGYQAAAARYEPPMRSFAPTDFEGDLDAPPLDPSASPSAPPDGNPMGQPRAPAFLRLRQWGLKGGMGLILGAFVVLYGGVTLLHRYDQPAVSPVSEDGVTKGADGSIASNGPNDSNLTGSANNELASPAPVQGAPGSALGAATPPNATTGASRTHPTSRAGAGPSRHSGRGRTHGHARAHGHAYAKRPHPRSPDTTYLHADVQPRRPSKQPETSLARGPYQPNAFRII